MKCLLVIFGLLSQLIAQCCKSILHNLLRHIQQALQRPINLMARGVMCHAMKVIITHYCWASSFCCSVCAAELNSFYGKARSSHVAPTIATHWLALWIWSPWQCTTFSLSLLAPSVHLEQHSPPSSSNIILPTSRANITECHRKSQGGLLEPKGRKFKLCNSQHIVSFKYLITDWVCCIIYCRSISNPQTGKLSSWQHLRDILEIKGFHLTETAYVSERPETQMEIWIIKVGKQQCYEEAKLFFVNWFYCLSPSLKWEICSFWCYYTCTVLRLWITGSLTDLYPVNNNSHLVCSLEDVYPGGLGEDD